MNTAQQINEFIAKHGATMSYQQHKQALDLWAAGVVRGEDIASALAMLKAEVERPGMTPLQKIFAANRQAQQRLSGHQMAAAKVGLDVNTPGLEQMSLADMRTIVAQQRDREYEAMRLRISGHNHRHGIAVDRDGIPVGRR